MPKLAFTRKENATLEQRIEILNWHHANGKNQQKTAKHFDVIFPNLWLKQPRISTWCKNEEKWWEEYELSMGSARSGKRVCQTQHPEVTEMLDLWVSKAMADGILLTGEVLRQKWRKFADLAGIPEDEWLNLSEGWLGRYTGKVSYPWFYLVNSGPPGHLCTSALPNSELGKPPLVSSVLSPLVPLHSFL